MNIKIIPNILASIILAVSVVGVAILSVQNATLISLKFLVYESIQLPVGIVLTLSASIGVIGGVIMLPLLINFFRQQSTQSNDNLEADFQPDQKGTDKEWVESGSKDW